MIPDKDPKSKLDYLKSKFVSREEIDAFVRRQRLKSKTIVFTNGCFDLLHMGHVDYLSKAADLGDLLIVGLNSDASAAGLKGPGRPITDEESRRHLLAALFFVDVVVLFDEPTPAALIEQIKPDILVKGGDYKPESIVGYDIVTKNGGKVVTIDFVPGYSTTAIEQKILQSQKVK
jgi:rfaE bifunctional protein nucleotidyltransferase chain/domain